MSGRLQKNDPFIHRESLGWVSGFIHSFKTADLGKLWVHSWRNCWRCLLSDLRKERDTLTSQPEGPWQRYPSEHKPSTEQ